MAQPAVVLPFSPTAPITGKGRPCAPILDTLRPYCDGAYVVVATGTGNAPTVAAWGLGLVMATAFLGLKVVMGPTHPAVLARHAGQMVRFTRTDLVVGLALSGSDARWPQVIDGMALSELLVLPLADETARGYACAILASHRPMTDALIAGLTAIGPDLLRVLPSLGPTVRAFHRIRAVNQ